MRRPPSKSIHKRPRVYKRMQSYSHRSYKNLNKNNMKLFINKKDTTIDDILMKAKGTVCDENPSSSLFHQKPGSDNMVRDELIAIIAAMQETESGGAYDPSNKFVYPEHDDDNQSEDKLSVNVECRSRMLDWCSNVSVYTFLLFGCC